MTLLSVPLWFRWCACGAYLALIAVLSLLPPSAFPTRFMSFAGADKVVHFLMYGGLSAILRWTLARSVTLPETTSPAASATGSYPWRIRRRVALAGAISYGLLMEIMQALFTGGMRFFGWDDVVANAAGAFVFWLIAGKLLKSRW